MSRSSCIGAPRLSRARAAPQCSRIGAKSLILKRLTVRASVAPERASVLPKSLILQRPSRARVSPPYYVRGRGGPEARRPFPNLRWR